MEQRPSVPALEDPGLLTQIEEMKGMGSVITGRDLSREEIGLIWGIDRSEIIEKIYYPEKSGLVLKSEYYYMTGWPPGEAETYTSLLVDCFDRGGWFHGLFEDGRLIGVVILDNKFIGKCKDLLQLKFLHVNCAYRRQGLGNKLFELAREAKGLYISVTPSENTVNFYLQRGGVVTREPDKELFELEPEDIHLECAL